MPELINWSEEISYRIADAAAAFDGYNVRERSVVSDLVLAGAKERPHLIQALIGSSIIEEDYFTEDRA